MLCAREKRMAWEKVSAAVLVRFFKKENGNYNV
jgi:hypothetical protein